MVCCKESQLLGLPLCIIRVSIIRIFCPRGGTQHVEDAGMCLHGGGGFSAKLRVGVCHPQLQNGTVG